MSHRLMSNQPSSIAISCNLCTNPLLFDSQEQFDLHCLEFNLVCSHKVNSDSICQLHFKTKNQKDYHYALCHQRDFTINHTSTVTSERSSPPELKAQKPDEKDCVYNVRKSDDPDATYPCRHCDEELDHPHKLRNHARYCTGSSVPSLVKV
jgi:hypothetical protein